MPAGDCARGDVAGRPSRGSARCSSTRCGRGVVRPREPAERGSRSVDVHRRGRARDGRSGPARRPCCPARSACRARLAGVPAHPPSLLPACPPACLTPRAHSPASQRGRVRRPLSIERRPFHRDADARDAARRARHGTRCGGRRAFISCCSSIASMACSRSVSPAARLGRARSHEAASAASSSGNGA